jgi:hypothetical protein
VRLWDHEAGVYVTSTAEAGAAGAAVGPLLSDSHYVAVTSWGAPR